MNSYRLAYALLPILASLLLAACKPDDPPTAAPVLISERLLSSDEWDDFEWSPDGSFLLVSRWEYDDFGGDQQQRDAPIGILNVNSGVELILPQTGYAPLWSPDGEKILIHTAGEGGQAPAFWLHSLSSGETWRLPGVRSEYVWGWLESGLYYQDAEGLWRTPIEGLSPNEPGQGEPVLGESQQVLAFDGSLPARWAIPSQDGHTFQLIDETDPSNRRWWLIQADGAEVRMPHPLYGLGACCAWSPDGKHFAFFGLDPGQGLYIVDSSGENLKRLVSARDMGKGAFIALDFSPDGRWIAFTWAPEGEGFPFDRNLIFVVGTDGKELQQLDADDAHSHNWLKWSPDGRHIAFKGLGKDIWLAEVVVP